MAAPRRRRRVQWPLPLVTAARPPIQTRATEPAALPLQRAGVRLADFDADGRADLFLVEPQSGLWFGALGGRGDSSYVPGQWSVAGEPIAADLNGDGRSDLFVYDASTGEWLQAMNMPNGRFITYNGRLAARVPHRHRGLRRRRP